MHRLLSVRVISYLLFILILDLAVAPALSLGRLRPVFALLFIPYVAFYWGWQKALPVAFVSGLARDMVGSLPLGVEVLSLVFMTIILDFLVQKMDRDALLTRALATFVFVFGTSLFWLVLSSFLSLPVRLTWYNTLLSVGMGVYGVALMPIFAFLTARWFHDRIFLKQYELF